ncbi:hypothetical protein M413DRAFT_441657 [Hebeloma cylindrosporum]|uniref:RRM domain-containing protein n=1 Tax=Hebeloma cylindrosporum TaxID=76867 RepID=A0A0C3CRN7_HEBCY|nr:hypothetical protein M413DRAFT_441657 [Hebeloma cylindrosporum h7]
MASSSDSSASSSKSASPNPQPESKKLKRKRKEPVQQVAPQSSDSEDSGDEHEVENEDEPSPTPVVEEPVLSHAERRRQKKEAKLAAKLKESTQAEEGTAVKKRKLKDGSAKVVGGDSTNKRQNSVWVGNMSFKTTVENLRAFFKECGEITRINMPTKAPTGPGVKPENRGFAYVDFATPEAKTAAIALSEQPLVGRKLLIKDGDDFAGRPAAVGADITINDPALAHKTHSKTAQKILRAQKQPPAPTLFFGNLGFETTDAAIRELLEAHRPGKKPTKDAVSEVEGEEKAKEKAKDVWIRKVRMGTFEDSGLCKGFAFVDFTSIEHATAALINPKNHHLNGRSLVVEFAGADAVRRGAPKSAKPVDGVEHKGRGGRKPPRADNPRYKTDRPPKQTEEQAETVETPATVEPKQKKSWDSKERAAKGDNVDGVRHKGPKSRPKPGAALALAKRESVAIVPSEGKKITF